MRNNISFRELRRNPPRTLRQLKKTIDRINYRAEDAERAGWPQLAASWREDLEYLKSLPIHPEHSSCRTPPLPAPTPTRLSSR